MTALLLVTMAYAFLTGVSVRVLHEAMGEKGEPLAAIWPLSVPFALGLLLMSRLEPRRLPPATCRVCDREIAGELEP